MQAELSGEPKEVDPKQAKKAARKAEKSAPTPFAVVIAYAWHCSVRSFEMQLVWCVNR
eukprot:SAG31_NODE_1033_length_10230_cov_15.289014_5_plen_58_part_00